MPSLHQVIPLQTDKTKILSFDINSIIFETKCVIVLEGLDLQSEKIGQRLKDIRNFLELTVEEFYSPVMKSFNNGSSIENNKRKLGKRLAKDIIEYHGINPAFLSMGEGEMLLRIKPSNKEKFDLLAHLADNPERVPYYDINLAEIQWQPAADIFHDSAPEYYVDYRPFNDCTAYLPVHGDSMYPRFNSGEIVAVKAMTNPDIILWGEAYLVVTDEHTNNLVAIRTLHQHANTQKIILRASNPDYRGDTVISRASIKKLYLIKGKVTRYQL